MPPLRRPVGDPPPCYGPNEEVFSVEINYGGLFCGFGRPSTKRKKNPVEEEEGRRMSRHGIVGHCSVCNVQGHNKRKCPELGRGPTAATGQDAPAGEAAPASEAAAAAAAPSGEDAPADQPATKTTKKKHPVKRKILCKPKETASTSVAASTTTHVYEQNVSVLEILQEQAISTQQSQTTAPSPLPESAFIAKCRDAIPKPRPTTSTLGLKRQRKKRSVVKTKENTVPEV